MSNKSDSNANTVARKPRGRGKPFKKGHDERRTGQFVANDPRANRAGQRSREVVATAAQARELYVRVLHEPINTPPDPAMTNLELIVRQHVAAAKKGDLAAREAMLDRIWGKAMVNLAVDVKGTHEHNHTITVQEFASKPADELVTLYSTSLGELSDVPKRW